MEINSILITDDHSLIIDGIKNVLKESFTVHNFICCHNPEQAIASTRKKTHNLYILDLGFRTDANVDIRRMDYIRQISTIDTSAKILVYTMREDFAMVSLLMEIESVKGIVLKGPEKEYLRKAVEIVINGGKYLCPRFKTLHRRSEEYRKRLQKRKLANGIPTDKELAIIRMIARGLDSENIAKELGHTVSTVKSYRRDLKVKFNVSGTIDLVITAILLNYITIDEVALNLLEQ